MTSPPLQPPLTQRAPTPPDATSIDDLLTGLVAQVTGLPPSLVRPRWQPTPPQQPPPGTDWCAVGVVQRTGHGFTYQRMTVIPGTTAEALLQRRWATFEALASFYGPNADDLAEQFRDGAQLSQNLAALGAAGVRLVWVNEINAVPDLVNTQWIGHQDVRLDLAREFDRYYPMQSVLEADVTFANLPAPPIDVQHVYFYAPSFGGTWDATHDVGDAINKALAAAAAVGGGTVIVPAGHYGQTTPIVNSYNGVHFLAQGLGVPRPTNHNQAFLAVTELIWIGAPDATMYTSTIPGDQQWSVDVTGILFNCNNLAAVGAHFTHVSFSVLQVGVSDPRLVGIWMDTQTIAVGPGNQNNEVWFFSRSVSPGNAYAPTGILLDSGPSSLYNTSGNDFHVLSAWYAQGDGVVFGNTDNNLIDNTGTFPNPGNATGRPIVFASSNYVMPNGLTTNGSARANISYHNELVTVLGYVSASTIVPGPNSGNAAVSPITLATNATTAARNATLHFADTTGVAVGMSVSGGGTSSGIMSGSTVGGLTAATVVMEQGTVGAVANPASVTFGFGVTRFATTGTYTLTAVDATHWNVVAPPKGNSQSNVATVGGVLSLTDMVIPLTGTPVAGDTFVVTVPTPAKNISIFGLDAENAAPIPLVEPGANAFVTTTSSPYPIPIRGGGNIPLIPILSTNAAFSAGGAFSGASGTNSAQVGGVAASATGFGALVTGHNTLSSSFYSFAGGEFNWADGFATRSFGSHGAARGRYNADTWGAAGANLGDLQITLQPLSILTTDATPTRLTADRGPPSAINTMNMVPHSAFRLTLEIVAHQTGGSAGTQDDTVTWTVVVLLKQGVTASTTALVAGYRVANTTLANTAIVANVGFTPTIGDAAASAWTITIGADATNGGIAVFGTGEANKTIEWLCRAVSIENVN